MSIAHDIYHRLAIHLATLGMGYPPRPELEAILRENFSPLEAEIALTLPTRVQPFQALSLTEISRASGVPVEQLRPALEALDARNLVYSGLTGAGEKGYALHQIGYGFPQSFFWKGEQSPTALKMAGVIGAYFKDPTVIRDAYGGSQTKPNRYIPVNQSIDRDIQAVFPYDVMEKVVEQARTIAVAHCGCRMFILCRRGASCGYPMEACIKYDELAEYIVGKGLGREISREKAIEIIKDSEERGMVHLVDNAVRRVQHTCNCCSCCCWSVGSLKRRRIPRDMLMATYYLRYTDESRCLSCGECVKACPVAAVTLTGDYPVIDNDWCIGCGVCVAKCRNGAAKLRRRHDVAVPAPDFHTLHYTIMVEKKLA